MTIDTKVKLNDGREIPILGLGTYESRGEETRDAVRWAIESGYRHFDTAASYGNEGDVGTALRESGIDRSELFVTTKMRNPDQGYDSGLRAFDASLDRLGLDYVDLYLIHWPLPGRRSDSWRALRRIHADGRARSIGVSNYMVGHLRELLDESDVVPAVNQFELHPYNYGSREEVVAFCREKDIAVEGYAPLAKADKLEDPTVVSIAEAHGKSAAQCMIRWALQHQLITIPKSTHQQRIAGNADVFDFELSDDEMRTLDGLDEDFITSWDPREVD
jgi:diketogulonate reductase-like aldo/keto reductase